MANTGDLRPVAFVTGGSRGIGAACAIALAGKGFDVAIAARTVREGTGVRHQTGVVDSDYAPISGSLETTAAEIEKRGTRALPVQIDLLDRASLDAGVDLALSELGRIDVLVNNAIYQGPGHMGLFLDTPMEEIERSIQGNILSQMVILKRVLPAMIEQGGGTVIHMTSAVASSDPPGPVGKGGWGIGYAASKGGFDRMAGVINAEHGPQGIRAYNIEPGFVFYGSEEEGRERYPGVPMTPPEAIGEAVAWLATDESAPKLLGKTVHGPQLCASKGLLPGWDGPS